MSFVRVSELLRTLRKAPLAGRNLAYPTIEAVQVSLQALSGAREGAVDATTCIMTEFCVVDILYVTQSSIRTQ
jgi:hypothetical protein